MGMRPAPFGDPASSSPKLPDTGHCDGLSSSYVGLGGLLLAADPDAAPGAAVAPVLAAGRGTAALLSYAVTHRVALGSHVWVLFEPPAWFMRPTTTRCVIPYDIASPSGSTG